MSSAEVSAPFLEVRGLGVRFPQSDGRVLHAVDDVSFTLDRGETLGIVGESGCGKSSVARAIVRLGPISAGSVRFDGTALEALEGRALRVLRRELQIVFQDARATLDPRMRIGLAIEQPLIALFPKLTRAERQDRVRATMERVGLDPAMADRYPGALSGGQCRRVGLARALVVGPRLLVCDEPLSGLDVSLQGQVANLLVELKRTLGLTLLLIAHDLALVRQLGDRVLVMYLGRVVELASCDTLYASPRHPYTRALLASVPVPDPRAQRSVRPLGGELPSPLAPPSGCAFRTRCAYAVERCAAERPTLRAVGESLVACHRADEPGWDIAGSGGAILSNPA
jgi:oligopeptide/dipeptide ABC transporter ATP-binding protein